MKSEWLTTSSFERAFEIVSAVNTLSIHAKLKLAEIDDPVDSIEVENARKTLLDLLTKLESLLTNAERDQSKIIVGVDPRLAELALQYLAEKRRLPPRSSLFALSLAELSKLIQSTRREDMAKQIECLESLRLMLQQFAQSDVAGIFGDE